MRQGKYDLIFIAGAPGVGKSSVASQLQKKFGGPCFEFGWIPEFRQRENKTISYEEEENVAFENLVLVAKNYIKHGFKNIIVTDLQDERILELNKNFSKYNYLLVTLTISDEGILKYRILNKNRSSKYRDWKTGLKLSKRINMRRLLPKEVRIDTTNKSVRDVVKEMLKYVEK